jgi:hypothetical protein
LVIRDHATDGTGLGFSELQGANTFLNGYRNVTPPSVTITRLTARSSKGTRQATMTPDVRAYGTREPIAGPGGPSKASAYNRASTRTTPAMIRNPHGSIRHPRETTVADTGFAAGRDSATGICRRTLFAGPTSIRRARWRRSRWWGIGEVRLPGIKRGVPADFREAGEQPTYQRFRGLRSRLKAARAMVAETPGLAETLARDWRKAARFYARFEISGAALRMRVSGEVRSKWAPTQSIQSSPDELLRSRD